MWLAHLFLASLALLWLGVLSRSVRSRSDLRFRVEPEADDCAAGLVSIVIPARDEVGNIGRCLDAVLEQDYDPIEVVVLDDGSTDGTADVLQAYAERINLVEGSNEPLPTGWLGKPWACHRASQHAEGDWLLFVDADVRLHPRAVSAAIAYAHHNELAMVSGLGRLTMEGFWEKVLQPAVGGLILAGNDLAVVNDPQRNGGQVLANGQFLLFRRQAYEAIGGHTAVCSNVLDDVGLARAVVGEGLPYHLTYMRRLFSCRMYDSLGSLWQGWSKNLFAGLEYSWPNLLVVCGFIGVAILLPYGLVVAGLCGLLGFPWLVWGVSLVLLIQGVRFYLDRAFEQEAVYGATHALGALMLIALLVNSGLAVRSGVKWKGRTVRVGPAAADFGTARSDS